jgi:hypothetical protein
MRLFFDLVLVSKTADLDYIKFTWNHMTDLEFKQRVKEEKMIKKADFIHILQVGISQNQWHWTL